jgi:hypothetical protein
MLIFDRVVASLVREDGPYACLWKGVFVLNTQFPQVGLKLS